MSKQNKGMDLTPAGAGHTKRSALIIKMKQKLSEILLEIASQGLKQPNSIEFEPMQPLMYLAHVAWNRDTESCDYLNSIYDREINRFPISEQCKREKLISTKWSDILEEMISYKKRHFPNDKRIITSCETTRQGNLRVKWK